MLIIDNNGIRHFKPDNVCALIINDSNEILTVSRKNNHKDLGLPGGKIDPDETVLDALKREVYEETGYIIEPINSRHFFLPPRNSNNYSYTATFMCMILNEVPDDIDKSKETGLVKWSKREELLTQHCSFRKYNKACFKFFKIKF